MMGHRSKRFKLFPAANLEGLLPANNFYRLLEGKLDLSFVRDLVRDRYEELGRPSIDPVVFFKLQLVLFFEGLRSERELVRTAADRLSLRWYLGYDLDESLPDHSSLTRIRSRYGLAVFRRFFEAVVEQCQQAGLVWGKELYFDATQVDANASLDSSAPRFAVETHPRRRNCRNRRAALICPKTGSTVCLRSLYFTLPSALASRSRLRLRSGQRFVACSGAGSASDGSSR
jgi:transposase